MISESSVRKIAEEVRKHEELQEELCVKLKRSGRTKGDEALEPELTMKITEKETEGKIVAVDGGLLCKELHSLDLVMTRSAGICFEYEKGKLKKCDYYPSKFPEYETKTENALETQDFNWLKNVERLNSEIGCAIETVKKFSPEALFLDGSIVPQVSDRPSSDSVVFPRYVKLVEHFKTLYALCEETNCMLAGVIKDSRGKHFINLVERWKMAEGYEEFLRRTNDTSLLYSLLNEGERTFSFKYAGSEEHPVLRDFRGFSERIAGMYLKPVKYDRPVRVDYLIPKNKEPKEFAEKLSTLVHSLSKLNRQYAAPAILIEADLRAAARPEEMEALYARIFSQIGMRPSILKLRRNDRPFR